MFGGGGDICILKMLLGRFRNMRSHLASDEKHCSKQTSALLKTDLHTAIGTYEFSDPSYMMSPKFFICL